MELRALGVLTELARMLVGRPASDARPEPYSGTELYAGAQTGNYLTRTPRNASRVRREAYH